jgi:hypothetical protein
MKTKSFWLRRWATASLRKFDATFFSPPQVRMPAPEHPPRKEWLGHNAGISQPMLVNMAYIALANG